MKGKKAGDIMIPIEFYPHIPYWFTLKQAIIEMEKAQIEVHGRKSLPRVILIFNEKDTLVGSVRRRDILRGLEPSFLLKEPLEYRKMLFSEENDLTHHEFSYEKLIMEARVRADSPVKDIMIPIKTAINYNDHIIKLMYEMVETNTSFLPVLKEGRVVGVVRSVDIFHEIAQIALTD